MQIKFVYWFFNIFLAYKNDIFQLLSNSLTNFSIVIEKALWKIENFINILEKNALRKKLIYCLWISWLIRIDKYLINKFSLFGTIKFYLVKLKFGSYK